MVFCWGENVSILLGQSNMLGFGKVEPTDKNGTLKHLIDTENKYPHLVNDQGKWTQRKDVRYVQVMHRRDRMSTLRNEWLTVKKPHIGIEQQFGHIMGHIHDEPPSERLSSRGWPPPRWRRPAARDHRRTSG